MTAPQTFDRPWPSLPSSQTTHNTENSPDAISCRLGLAIDHRLEESINLSLAAEDKTTLANRERLTDQLHRIDRETDPPLPTTDRANAATNNALTDDAAHGGPAVCW